MLNLNKLFVDKVKAGIACCKDISDCKYKTKDNCPYRKTEITCDRPQMMEDIMKLLNLLENEVHEQEEMIINARIALDANCDDCDRW